MIRNDDGDNSVDSSSSVDGGEDRAFATEFGLDSAEGVVAKDAVRPVGLAERESALLAKNFATNPKFCNAEGPVVEFAERESGWELWHGPPALHHGFCHPTIGSAMLWG
jgi:hypothetical protein